MSAFTELLNSPTKMWYVLARDIEYVGSALFYGGLAFLALLWPDGATSRGGRRVLIASWSVGALGTLGSIGLEGAWVAQRAPSAAWDRRVLSSVLSTDFGREWAAMGLLWLLGLVVLADVLRRGSAATRSLPWRVAAVAVGVGTLRVFGLTGHSRDTAEPTIAQLADVVHLVAVSAWIGGLAMVLFAVLPRGRIDELRTVVPRYSTLALVSVALAAASGAVLAWRILGSVHAVTSTTYGQTLLVKLALLAAVLFVAYFSKVWVEHRLDFAVIRRSGAGIVRPFVVSVAAETALLVLVLTVASVLVTADPGR
jgi:copper transport protein